jgi:hypothetical protein
MCLDKKRGVKARDDEKRKKKNGIRKKYQSPEGAALPSFLSHGRAGLDSFHHHSVPSVKTH